jgi:hypothetical protein
MTQRRNVRACNEPQSRYRDQNVSYTKVQDKNHTDQILWKKNSVIPKESVREGHSTMLPTLMLSEVYVKEYPGRVYNFEQRTVG